MPQLTDPSVLIPTKPNEAATRRLPALIQFSVILRQYVALGAKSLVNSHVGLGDPESQLLLPFPRERHASPVDHLLENRRAASLKAVHPTLIACTADSG